MKSEMEGRMQEFERSCHSHGLRITPQRVAIYARLLTSKSHPSATDIYEEIKGKFPNMSLGTVNSTLISFARIGLARIVEASGDPKRFDPDMEPHHHFRCTKCGIIIDFRNKAYDRINVPEEIAKKYLVFGKKVYLEGLCDKCRAKNKP